MRSLSWWARLLAAFVVLSLACDNSDAQIIYTRPSKGRAITVFSEATAQTSSAFDWTAFDGMQVSFSLSCAGGEAVAVRVLGAYSLTDTFSASKVSDVLRREWGVSSCAGGVGATYSYNVSGLPPYVKFQFDAVETASISLTVVPIPFAQSMEVRGSYPELGIVSSPAPVLTGGLTVDSIVRTVRVDDQGRLATGASTTAMASTACTVTDVATKCHTSSTTVCSVDVANRNTVDAYCSQTNGVTTATGFPINAAASANKAGGSRTFHNYGGDVYCIAAAGLTATVNIQPNACP